MFIERRSTHDERREVSKKKVHRLWREGGLQVPVSDSYVMSDPNYGDWWDDYYGQTGLSVG